MDQLLCEEEISWSPCSPYFDEDSTCDQSSCISSPDSMASNCSIHCSTNSSFISSDSMNQHCSSSSCTFIKHQSSSSCKVLRVFSTATTTASVSSSSPSYWPSVEEHELNHLLHKELEYMPDNNHLTGLQVNDHLNSARSAALQWLIEAQCTFNFSSITIALAINYFDRYLAKNLSKVWTSWMLELLSTACLSTAAKMEEISVPQLPDLQVGSRKHTFDTATVQRMELLLLNTLQWKMRSVTPFSFVELALCGFSITPHLQNMLLMRISELLIAALLETSFLQFCPSVLATTSIFCALEELAPSQIDHFKSSQLAKQIFCQNEDKFWHCYKLMEAEVIDPTTSSRALSPSSDDDGHIHFEANGPLEASNRPLSQNYEGISGFLFESLFTSQSTSNYKSYLCLYAISSTSSKKRKRAHDME